MPYVFEQPEQGKYELEKEPLIPADYGAGSEMFSGLTFGFGDEIRSKVTGEPIEAIRAGQENYRKQNPGASTVANLVGSLPTALIPGAGAARAITGVGKAGMAGRTAATLGTGATYGALTGAGEQTEGNRGRGAAAGAAIGAIGGTIGAGVGRGVQAVAQRRLRTLPADLQAQGIALGRLKASDLTPEKAIQNLVEGRTIAELGRPLETLAGATVRRSPEVAGKFVENVAARRATRPEQLTKAVQKEVAPDFPVTASQIEKITGMQRQSAAPLYERAFQEAGPIQSDRIDQLMTLEPFQAAYKRAQSIANLEGKPIPDYVPGQPMSLRAANYVKQGLDEVVYGAKRDPSSSIGKTQLGLIDARRADFLEEVDKFAPESYKQARAVYAGGARNQEAAEAGAEAWKRGPEYVADFLANASEAEKAAFRAGANATLQTEATKLGANREAFRALMDSPMRQQVVQQLSVVEGPSAVPFIARQQRQAADFEQRMIGGSQTAERQAADEAFGGESLPVQIAQQGIMPTIYRSAIQPVVDRATTGNNQVVSELGGLLLNPSRDANLETLRRLGLLEEQLRRQAGIRAGSYTTGSAAGGGLLGGSE